jgi:hypothetical protein
MKRYKISKVEVPRHAVVRLTYDDGFSGEVDFADTLSRGGVMECLADPALFRRAQIGEGGRSLGWVNPEGEVVDFCADALRFKAEEQVVRERAERYEASRTAAAE